MEYPHLSEELVDKLEDMETQYGPMAGKLAMAMDLITDAEISAGQLSVYCRHGLDASKTHPDLENLQKYIIVVRQLIKNAFRERETGNGRERRPEQ